MKFLRMRSILLNKIKFTSIKNIKHRIKNLIDPFDRPAILKSVNLNIYYQFIKC